MQYIRGFLISLLHTVSQLFFSIRFLSAELARRPYAATKLPLGNSKNAQIRKKLVPIQAITWLIGRRVLQICIGPVEFFINRKLGGGFADWITAGDRMISQKDTELAQLESRLREAIERFKSYINAGKMEDVRRALATKNISASTMRNWTKDTKRLWTSYRRTEFADAIGTLPDLDREKRNQAYEFALKELGVGIEGQHELENYDGKYRLFHNFPGIGLNNFVIKVEHSPFVVIFALKYLNRDSHRGKCDGLIVLRHGRLVCAGFSPTTVFQAVFRCVGYPQKELIRGMAFIEDLNTQEVSFSTIVIARDPNSAASSEATKMVQSSGRSL